MDSAVAVVLGAALALGVAALVAVVLRRRSRSPGGPEHEGVGLVPIPNFRPSAATKSLTALSAPNELVLGAPDNPLISVVRADVSLSPRRRESIAVPEAARNALTPILQHAPRVLISGAATVGSVTKLAMVFSPEATARLATGALELSPSSGFDGAVRAIARDPVTKKFVENANILQRVDPAVVVAGVWQVASIVTAQKYLAVIEARLGRIEQGVSAILGFLDDVVSAKLEADLAYLHDRAETMHKGRLTQGEVLTVANQLEEIDRTTRAVSQQRLRQLDRDRDEVTASRWDDGWFGAEDRVKQATALVGKAEQSARSALLSGQVRLLAASLRSSLGLQDEYTARALQSVAADMDTCRQEWLAFTEAMDDKLPNLKATFQLGDTDKKQQASVRRALGDAGSSLDRELADTSCAIKDVHAAVARKDQELGPLHLEVEVDASGRILRAERLLPA